MLLRFIATSSVLAAAALVVGAPLIVVAEGPAPAPSASAQGGAAVAPLSNQDVSKAIQENAAAIQRFAALHRQTNEGLKASFDKLVKQGEAFRESVDQKVLSKDPKGAVLLKKEKSIRDELAALSEKVKLKQQELSALAPQRAELMQKVTKDPDFLALSAENSQRTKAINEELVTFVGQVSEEGKGLVVERSRLLALQKPPVAAAVPPVAGK